MNVEDAYLFFADLYNDGLSKSEKNEADYKIVQYNPEFGDLDQIKFEIDHIDKKVTIFSR